ncbi:hypothetical protein [Streptomyces sp. NPDC051109]|uniref:hypothetical protein n=1 Tax=Streptomyces sp. NPDC051109 TaxID=3365642 RepID=UPI00379CA6E1
MNRAALFDAGGTLAGTDHLHVACRAIGLPGGDPLAHMHMHMHMHMHVLGSGRDVGEAPTDSDEVHGGKPATRLHPLRPDLTECLRTARFWSATPSGT